MEKRFKDLTDRLTNELESLTFVFLINNTKDEEDTSDMINFILSAYMSAMFNMMRDVAQCDESRELVDKFMRETIEFISQRSMIIDVFFQYKKSNEQ